MKKFLKAAATLVGLTLVSAVATEAIKRFGVAEKIVDAAVTGYAKVAKQVPSETKAEGVDQRIASDGMYR